MQRTLTKRALFSEAAKPREAKPSNDFTSSFSLNQTLESGTPLAYDPLCVLSRPRFLPQRFGATSTMTHIGRSS
jgi:hypothetical protein